MAASVANCMRQEGSVTITAQSDSFKGSKQRSNSHLVDAESVGQ